MVEVTRGSNSNDIRRKVSFKMNDKKKIKRIILAIVAVVFIAGGVVGVVYGIPAYQNYRSYQSAEKMLEEGQYEEAKNAFWALGTYKDSADKIKECDYQSALSLEKEKKFSEAKSIFEELGEYKDSKEQITACEYGRAEEYLAKKDYEAAQTIYAKLGKYKDSAEKIKACQYGIAENYLSSKEYDKARKIYKELGKYQDAKNKLKECDYQEALQHLYEGEYDTAIGRLKGIKDYSDAKKKLKEAQWKKAYTEVIDDWTIVRRMCKQKDKYIGQGDDYDYMEEYFTGFTYDYYTLKDLDKDKIPELLLYSQDSSMTAILTYKSKLIYVGTFYNASYSSKYGIFEDKTYHGASDYYEYHLVTFAFKKKKIETIANKYTLEDSMYDRMRTDEDGLMYTDGETMYYYIEGGKLNGMDVVDKKGKIYKVTEDSFVNVHNAVYESGESFSQLCDTSLSNSDIIRKY